MKMDARGESRQRSLSTPTSAGLLHRRLRSSLEHSLRDAVETFIEHEVEQLKTDARWGVWRTG